MARVLLFSVAVTVVHLSGASPAQTQSQSSSQAVDVAAALKQLVSDRTIVIVVEEERPQGDSKAAYVSANGGIAKASYYAFLSASVASLQGRVVTFQDGARVVVGDSSPVSAPDLVAATLLAAPEQSRNTKGVTKDGVSVAGAVGRVGLDLKRLDPVTLSDGPFLRDVKVKSIVRSAACKPLEHWHCS